MCVRTAQTFVPQSKSRSPSLYPFLSGFFSCPMTTAWRSLTCLFAASLQIVFGDCTADAPKAGGRAKVGLDQAQSYNPIIGGQGSGHGQR